MADSYSNWLKKDMGQMVEMIKIDDLQKHYIMSRWLDQVIWMEGKATQARDRYYRLRLTTIVGGVTVPALVGLNALGGDAG